MPEHGIRSPLTQCPVRLEMLDHHGVIASASAFFYESEDNRTFLVTNWHNVSGRNFVTGAPNQQDTGVPRFPTRVSAKIVSDTGSIDADGSAVLDVRGTDLPLYDEDYTPVWLEHPTTGPLCDVVALPMERPTSASPAFHRPANTVSPLRIPVRPGNTVFIIGYPHGITVSKGLPVWKSGYIASEPHFPVTLQEARPLRVAAFFIDSADQEGDVRCAGLRRVCRELEHQRPILLGCERSTLSDPAGRDDWQPWCRVRRLLRRAYPRQPRQARGGVPRSGRGRRARSVLDQRRH